jgi:hypothetical protein
MNMKFAKRIFLTAIPAMGMLLFYQSCTKMDIPLHEKGGNIPEKIMVDNRMVLYWNNKAATVLGVPMRQPDRSRYFAIIEIAVHDALNSVRPKFETYLADEPTPNASPNAAIASAAYWAIKGLNLQGSFPVDAWYDSSLAVIADGDAKEAGKVLGKHVADAIIANRADDGFTQVIPSSLVPANGTTPGAYRQTNGIPFRLIPNWGTVLKPFVTESNEQFRPEGPYDLATAAYANDYNEVKGKGAREASTRTEAETNLAKFWADNKPSNIWNNFVNSVIADKKLDAWKTARLFAIIHTAIADGFNTVLEAKYHFYFWRPETAIHEGTNDNNAATAADAGWLPFVIETVQPTPPGNWVSPPIPEYPSGYALPGGVVAEVLKRLLGSDKISVDFTSASLPGTTLHYNSLAKAARDNAEAKIFAGWYFRKAVLDGENMGKKVGEYVFLNRFREQ